MVRTALFEAANVMLTRAVRFSTLKAWALGVAGRHATCVRSARPLRLTASFGGAQHRASTTDRSTSPATWVEEQKRGGLTTAARLQKPGSFMSAGRPWFSGHG